MKKIFLFLLLVFTTNSFASWTQTNFSNFQTYMTYANAGSYQLQIDSTFVSGYSWVMDTNISTFNRLTNTYQTASIIFWNRGTKYVFFSRRYSSDAMHDCIEFATDSNEGLFTCTDSKYNFAPNPDPTSDNGICNDLYQKDGQAYTCNPNTNEATPIDNSNGLTTDPEDGKDIPNCNDGYEWSSMGAGGTQTNSTPTHTVYSCIPTSTTGTGAGDTGGSTNPNVGTVTNPDGTTTTTLPDGTTHTYSPSSQTTVTTYPDGTQTTTYHDNSNGGTDGGSTGGDSGSGSSTGGTSGTGSTGGTTGTDSGTGSTGGTTGTTDGGSTGGTSSSGGVGSSTTTGGTGSTTGTDTGTGSTGGTTGTDSGTGSTNGTGSTGTTETPTEEPVKAGSCGSSNMTLLEKTLCETKALFSPKTPIESNPLEGSDSLITGVIGEYTSFKNNIVTQGDTLKTLVYTSIDTVNQGFDFTISSNEVVNCPKNYDLILSALNMPNMSVTLDICEQSSKLKPYFYPMFLIMFSVMTTILTFRMLGVLL